jgi:hypothetical protein
LKNVITDFNLGIDIDKFIEETDTDGNGTMDYDEFVTLFHEDEDDIIGSSFVEIVSPSNKQRQNASSTGKPIMSKKSPSDGGMPVLPVSGSPRHRINVTVSDVVDGIRMPLDMMHLSTFLNDARKKLQPPEHDTRFSNRSQAETHLPVPADMSRKSAKSPTKSKTTLLVDDIRPTTLDADIIKLMHHDNATEMKTRRKKVGSSPKKIAAKPYHLPPAAHFARNTAAPSAEHPAESPHVNTSQHTNSTPSSPLRVRNRIELACKTRCTKHGNDNYDPLNEGLKLRHRLHTVAPSHRLTRPLISPDGKRQITLMPTSFRNVYCIPTHRATTPLYFGPATSSPRYDEFISRGNEEQVRRSEYISTIAAHVLSQLPPIGFHGF